jgi:hypothetical protein
LFRGLNPSSPTERAPFTSSFRRRGNFSEQKAANDGESDDENGNHPFRPSETAVTVRRIAERAISLDPSVPTSV